MATTALLKTFPDTRQVWSVISAPSTQPDPFTYDRKCELLFSALPKDKSLDISLPHGGFHTKPLDIDGIRRHIMKDTFSLNIDSLLRTDAQSKYVLDLINFWRGKVEVENLISGISALPNVMHAERISNRLSYLRKVFLEEQDNDISVDSIRTFTIFLSMHPDVRYPAITLTPAGYIYAQWKKGSDSHDSLFSLHFLSDWDVRFVVFSPNEKHPAKITRISGTEVVDTILSNMDKAYDVSSWVVE
jgi:hypothetical protein